MELLGILHGDSGVTSFDDLLVRAAGVVLAGTIAWFLAVVVAVVVEAVTLGRLRPARFTGAPAPLRRALLAVAVGALAVLGIGPAAQAGLRPHETQLGDADHGHALGAAAVLEGLPLPDRTLGGLPTVTVRPGDSLWRIAARLLPGADDAGLVVAMHSLHAHNRAVLGSDPDLLRPGQRLVVPPSLPSTQEHA